MLAKIRKQRVLGQIALLPVCGLIAAIFRHYLGYRIRDLQTLRKQFREITAEKTPLLICMNHLTTIDSALIIWALASNPWYLFNYRCFSWNLPASDFFERKAAFRIIGKLTKCIFIRRDGDMKHHNQILGVCKHLLEKGEVVTIFPEGRRSRSGRFEPEKVAYGSGKLVAMVPNCRVLCIYLRSDLQKTYSDYPPKGSDFTVLMEVIRPTATQRGRSAYTELTAQVAATLKRMEADYFASRTQEAP